MRFPTKLTAFPNISTWVIARSTTWRRINAAATIGEQFVEFILSSSDLVEAEASSAADQNGSGGSGQPTYELGIGLDTTTANSATQSWGLDGAIVKPSQVWSRLRSIANVGKHSINLVEQNVSNRDVLVYGNNGGTIQKSGMIVDLRL